MSYREALMILGVSEPYDMIELKKAYREKAKAFHPDINSSDVNNNTKMMQLVNEAYSVIKNSNQSHMEKDNDQVPKEKNKWSKFSQQEKEIIKRLCAELDILVMDAALEYENAKPAADPAADPQGHCLHLLRRPVGGPAQPDQAL